MANIANKYKLGIFVFASIVILIAALFVFGSFAFLKPRIKCMTVVNSSVQGLSVGAKVKFSGVPIGEITSIRIAQCNSIYIYMDVFTECIVNNCDKGDSLLVFREYLRNQVDKGLRCQLRYEGITGTLYQELQYYNTNDYPEEKLIIPPPEDNKVIFIPSVSPVLFGSIMKRIDMSLSKFSGIDKIFADVGKALHKVNMYLEDPKINDVMNNVQAISINIHDISKRFQETLTGEKINKITTELTTTMEEIKIAVKNLNKQLNESKLPETSESARVLMQTTTKQLNEAIANFNSTTKSIKALSEELDNNPSSIIWGTDKKKVIPSY